MPESKRRTATLGALAAPFVAPFTVAFAVAFVVAPAGLFPGLARAAGTVDVQIKGNLFLPEAVTIKAGSTVRWTNAERRTSHSVLFPAESLESERMLPDENWQRRFDKPGRYPYTCGPHPEMKGLVVVTE